MHEEGVLEEEEEEEEKEEGIKTGKDFAKELAIMRLQNIVLLKELEKAEAVAKELQIKIKLLEETEKKKEAKAVLKEEE